MSHKAALQQTFCLGNDWMQCFLACVVHTQSSTPHPMKTIYTYFSTSPCPRIQACVSEPFPLWVRPTSKKTDVKCGQDLLILSSSSSSDSKVFNRVLVLDEVVQFTENDEFPITRWWLISLSSPTQTLDQLVVYM